MKPATICDNGRPARPQLMLAPRLSGLRPVASALARPLLARPFAMAASTTPVEDLIRERLAPLNPTRLEIFNDSHHHAHHAPMAGGAGASGETHFRLVITADAFQAKRQPQRHRMVYALLDDEMKRAGGIHALQLRTMTPEEEAAREQQNRPTGSAAVTCKADK